MDAICQYGIRENRKSLQTSLESRESDTPWGLSPAGTASNFLRTDTQTQPPFVAARHIVYNACLSACTKSPSGETGRARPAMPHLLDALNRQQREAVETTEGPLLILAGAGSGKTRVITYRIAYLIESRAVPPQSVLAVTFTNKAADQMKSRVAALLSGGFECWPHISTFHSFCVRVLRRNIDRLGYTRDFSIYDEDDQQRILKVCLQELGLSEQIASPRAALGRISFAKNHGMAPADMYRQAADPVTEKLATLFERYEKKLRQANALDFDDLLLKTVELLDAAPAVCEDYSRRYRYILVDEYQDTNRTQYRL